MARRKRYRAGPLRALQVDCKKEETHSRRREQDQEKHRGLGNSKKEMNFYKRTLGASLVAQW